MSFDFANLLSKALGYVQSHPFLATTAAAMVGFFVLRKTVFKPVVDVTLVKNPVVRKYC
jgi:hypothetical protein